VSKYKILVVDDEEGVRFGICSFLEAQGYQLYEAGDCSDAEKVFRTNHPDFVILDYLLPDGNAINLLEIFKKSDPEVPVILLTAHGSIELAVEAIKKGAEHFLTKPVELPTLLTIIKRLLENQRIRRKQRAGGTIQSREFINPFVGKSARINELAEQAHKIATSDSPVLILGETGSGKGILASWLHYNSLRSDEAFVDLSCAGLSKEFLESELFGHEKGAFTGAVAMKPGLLEVAHRGTFFLDEIGDVDLSIQPKLLKVLEEKRFRRVGGINDHQVDVRLVAATNRDLEQMIRQSLFRNDLYFRINTIPLYMPPLRERSEDIPELARIILKRYSTDMGQTDLELSEEAIIALQSYDWPGNVRELRNVIERAVLLSDKKVLESKDLLFSTRSPVDSLADSANMTLMEIEKSHIEKVLRQENGNVKLVAEILGIPKSTLYQKIKKYKIQVSKI
jgi:DNA-binding NtrC family response regulator